MPEQEDHRLIKPIEAAHFPGLSRSWPAKLRLTGDGPPYMKVGRTSATAERPLGVGRKELAPQHQPPSCGP